MKKSLALLCQVFYPDDQATSILFSDLMKSLDSEYNITVYSGYPSQSARAKIKTKIKKVDFFSKIKIIRCGIQIDPKKSFIHRIISYFSFLIEAKVRILFTKSDILMAVTNPFFNLWLTGIIAYIKKIRTVFVFLDIYPEGLIALDSIKEKSFVSKTWIKLNRLSLKRIDDVIIIGRDMRHIVKKYDIEKKLTYIPHWSSTKPSRSINFEESAYTKKRDLKDKFVIQYSGNMGLWHDIDSFVLSANELKDIKDIQYSFIGGGIKQNQAKKLANKLNICNISWENFVELNHLEDSLAACHMALISLNRGLEGIAVPSKLYGILASARPIIALVPENSEIALTIDEHKCGFVITPGDFKKLSEIVMECYQGKHNLNEMGKNSFNAFIKNYSLKSASNDFKKILK